MGIFMYSTVLFINVLLWFSFSFSYFFTGRSGDITLISFFLMVHRFHAHFDLTNICWIVYNSCNKNYLH
jgi:hypothetical protein